LLASVSWPESCHRRLQKRLEQTLPEENPMLWTFAVILIVLWLFGLLSSYTMGGFIHILLVVAVIMILVRLVTGRRVA